MMSDPNTPKPSSDDWGKADVASWRSTLRRAMQPIEDRFGVVAGRRHQRAAQKSWSTTELSPAVLRAAAQSSSAVTDSDAPIFVLGATWRSGSTLLQRLLLSSGDVMMWGEPWNRCDLVQRMRESLRPIDERWPAKGNVVDELTSIEPLHTLMVPDLYPERADLLAAHRAMFDRLYGDTAAARGYARWGMKETRLSAQDARYLHALYPNARMVLLYRDPFASWTSYVALRAQGYARWPDEPIVSPHDFGAMWRDRVQGFLDYPDELPHVKVSYEALIEDPAVLDELALFCGVEPDRSTLEQRVGRSHNTRSPEASMRRVEKAVGSLASELGYRPPSA